jgi:hypothetical protein
MNDLAATSNYCDERLSRRSGNAKVRMRFPPEATVRYWTPFT